MEPLLDLRAFSGTVIDARASGATFAGAASFDGCIAVVQWPRAEVERLLPPELELAPGVSPSVGAHPVAFVFGEQNRGAWIWGGVTLPIGLEYHEMLIGVPFVKHREGRILHTYIPRMYASNSTAVWDGNVRYGLAKQMADMRWWNSTFVLTAPEGGLLFHAAVEPEAPSSGPLDLPAARAIGEMFSLPALGRRETGQYVCSYFDWGLEAAAVRAADACLSIDAPLCTGLETRVCHTPRGGALIVRDMAWKLSWPLGCRF